MSSGLGCADEAEAFQASLIQVKQSFPLLAVLGMPHCATVCPFPRQSTRPTDPGIWDLPA